MITDIDKQLMLRFLEKNYPVSRVKHDMKFRRAIVLDSGVYVLGIEEHHRRLKFELVNILKTVFCCDEAITRVVLSNFLQLG